MNRSTKSILRVDASPRADSSITRKLGDELLAQLSKRDPQTRIVSRDVSAGLPFVDHDWIEANFTAEKERTAAHRKVLALSDELVAELKAADTIVITVPIHNFGIPATLKAWIDLVARARLTFRYTEDGPVGLLTDKSAIVIVASGGTPVGSEADFASAYLRHVLGFIGVKDVEVIAADQLTKDPGRKDAALAEIESVAEQRAAA
jgi:FMN-dependent NADH-azoreductase